MSDKQHLGCCPNCGSGDMHWCHISVRAYCRECNWWQPVNFGSKEKGLEDLKEIQLRREVEETNMAP